MVRAGRRLEALPGSPFWAPGAPPEAPGTHWLWWVAGGLLGGGVSTGAMAWWTHEELSECRGTPTCAGTGRVDDLAGDVRRRALAADALVLMGLAAGAAAALSSPPKTNP